MVNLFTSYFLLSRTQPFLVLPFVTAIFTRLNSVAKIKIVEFFTTEFEGSFLLFFTTVVRLQCLQWACQSCIPCR